MLHVEPVSGIILQFKKVHSKQYKVLALFMTDLHVSPASGQLPSMLWGPAADTSIHSCPIAQLVIRYMQ